MNRLIKQEIPFFQIVCIYLLASTEDFKTITDLFEKAAKHSDVVEFCQYSHHLNYIVFYITQNVFANGQYFRIISLNTEYFLLFKQNRDQSQMLALAKQAFPGQVSYFMDSYKKGHAKSFRISSYRPRPENASL